MNFVKKWAVKIIVLMIGLTIAHLGCTLFILSNLGNDPYNVLIQGLYRSIYGATGLEFLTHGRVHVVVCVIIVLVLLIVDKSYIKIGTLLCMIFGGPIIDVFTLLLQNIITDNLVVRIIAMALGSIILAFGMTIVIKSDCGTGPNDLVAVVISDKIKKNFGVIRIIVDVLFVAVGFMLSGTVGVGTLCCAFLVGPVANFFMPMNEKIINSIYKKSGIM
ncbi:MAG: hypothetical protein Q4D29_04010 [Lachnospiraceae bacterium]|nr:hypothetical protein [Lachnospiraceae bacterium]